MTADDTGILTSEDFELQPPEVWRDGILIHDGARTVDPAYGGILGGPATTEIVIPSIDAATTWPDVEPLAPGEQELRRWAIEQVSKVATGKPSADGLIDEAKKLEQYILNG